MEATQTLIINRIITAALKRKATDLHLAVGNNPVLRIDNKLHILAEEEIITADFLDNLSASLLNQTELKELKDKLEASFVHDYGNHVKFRVNIFYQKKFLNISFRFISPTLPLLKEAGLPRVVQNIVNLKKGLVIIGGGYNSGRTTTAFSLLEHINKTQKRYILTVEKPIEFFLTSNKSIIAQRSIPTDVKSYGNAIESCESEDVDVVMIDDLDQSADVLMKIFELAASGKLIIAIMSAQGVMNSIEKILYKFTEDERERARTLLSRTLELIFIQKLVPRIGGGRILVPEILVANEAVKSNIEDDRISQLANIIQTSREEGMISADKSLYELVNNRQISVEEAFEYASNKESFKLMMR